MNDRLTPFQLLILVLSCYVLGALRQEVGALHGKLAEHRERVSVPADET